MQGFYGNAPADKAHWALFGYQIGTASPQGAMQQVRPEEHRYDMYQNPPTQQMVQVQGATMAGGGIMGFSWTQIAIGAGLLWLVMRK